MNSNENAKVSCPIYFENHQYGGNVTSIENFSNINFGEVRTTIINGKPYFCAIDICRGLFINVNKCSQTVFEAASDIHMASAQVDTNLRSWGPNLDYELYYIISIDVDSMNQYGARFKRKIDTIFISESILYMLMFKSRKREAINFKVWLATEILPNMRILGFDKSVQLVSQEANAIADYYTKMNEKYNHIVNIAGEVIEAHSNDMNYFCFEADQIKSKIDQLGAAINGSTAGSVYRDSILDKKITDIATGLNQVFGRKQ